jgi:hypothetical protein
VDFYVQEWLAAYRPFDELYVSYGRENLQWGPSFLLSPSNPFNSQNGRDNTKLEVPGSDYGKVIWTPGSSLSVSLIANTCEGRLDLAGEFEPAYAVKVDYVLEGKTISLVASRRRHDDPRGGLTASWNATESIILYCEAGVGKDDPELLVGNSITLDSGAVFAFEYFYNGSGSRKDPMLLLVPPYKPLDSYEIFFRKNYLLIQYSQLDVAEVLDLTLRLTLNIDDGSSRLAGLAEYEVGDHMKLFAVGMLSSGNRNDEFGNIVNNSVMAGIDYVF